MIKNLVRKASNNFTFLEQSLVSFFNFALLLIIGLFLTPSDFSSFVVIFAVGTLVFSMCSAFITQPMLVFIRSEFENEEKEYVSKLSLYATLLATVLSSFLLIGVSVFIFKLTLEVYLLSISYFTAWNFYETIRRYSITSKENITKSIFVSSLVLILTFIGLITLVELFNAMTLNVLLLSLTLSYFGAGLYYLRYNPLVFRNENKSSTKIIKLHFSYGKWTIGGLILFWGYTQGYIMILALNFSAIDLGSFRTMMNLVSVISIFTLIFENKHIPLLSKMISSNKSNDQKSTKKHVKKMYSDYFGYVVLLLVTTYLFSYGAYNLFYSQKYPFSNSLLILFLFYQLVLIVSKPLVIYYKSNLRNHLILLAHLFAFFGMLLTYFIIHQKHEVHTMVYPLIFSGIMFCLVLLIKYKKGGT